MDEVVVLREFLRLLTLPRHEAKGILPDGSGLWLCLAYGLERAVDALTASDEVRPSTVLLESLRNLAARVGQFARASKHWTADAEWESVEHFAREAQALIAGTTRALTTVP